MKFSHILWSECASTVIKMFVSANLPSSILLYLVVWCALCSVKHGNSKRGCSWTENTPPYRYYM